MLDPQYDGCQEVCCHWESISNPRKQTCILVRFGYILYAYIFNIKIQEIQPLSSPNPHFHPPPKNKKKSNNKKTKKQKTIINYLIFLDRLVAQVCVSHPKGLADSCGLGKSAACVLQSVPLLYPPETWICVRTRYIAHQISMGLAHESLHYKLTRERGRYFISLPSLGLADCLPLCTRVACVPVCKWVVSLWKCTGVCDVGAGSLKLCNQWQGKVTGDFDIVIEVVVFWSVELYSLI